MLSTETNAWLVGLGLLLYTVAVIIDRLYFDPLSKFPGPKLAALTRYYEAYFDVWQNGQYIYKIQEMHKQYGSHVA